jgi:predicted Zn-dependent peptidase
MVKLKSFLVLFACVLGMQALAKSGTLSFEDFLLRDTSHVIHGTLDNGFQYYIVKEAQKPFQMSLLQKTGFHDDGETPEISHLLEHMLATANRPIATGDTLIQYLKKLGKEYGTGFNAFTGANFMNSTYINSRANWPMPIRVWRY